MTTQTLPQAPAALAAALRERNLPGRRSQTAITKLRRSRAARKAEPPRQPPLAERLTQRLLEDAVAEIRRRGGEVAISSKDWDKPLAIVDRVPRDRMMLLHVDGWRYYGRRHPYRRAQLSYLVGHDDAGRWAVRVPGTITTVAAALHWITPQQVHEALAAGRRVLRQGDVYAIETTGRFDGAGAETLPAAHRWNPKTRYLVHHPEDGRKHRPLRAVFPVRFVVQRVYEMGRSGGRANGD